jgi:hypothetical protein
MILLAIVTVAGVSLLVATLAAIYLMVTDIWHRLGCDKDQPPDEKP